VLWVVGVFLGTQMSLDLVWKMSDALNGMMAIPNLIALILLAPVVFRLTREYFSDPQAAEQALEISNKGDAG
jgi:AGCS family alanine or glycine:cation symporter